MGSVNLVQLSELIFYIISSKTKMFSKQLVLAMFLVTFAATFLDHVAVEARYLPTRSNGERIDKLKELLREVSKIYKVFNPDILCMRLRLS